MTAPAALMPQLSPVLDRLCPMHLRLDAGGGIAGVGPTLRKLRPGQDLIGQPFFELFELRRPRAVSALADLLSRPAAELHLKFRDPPETAMKGVIAPLPAGGAVVNLSFGISLFEAVRAYRLTGGDFAATELAIEMLYLMEAKSAAMAVSRQLNVKLQGARIAAEEQAFTDTLTGLRNRRAMDHVLDRLVIAGRAFALMHLDLDRFKAVNDTLGHPAGDAVLRRVARIMLEETRKTDTVARIGGDEFVIILDQLVDPVRLDRMAHSLIARIQDPVPVQGQTARISTSIGTVISEGEATSAAQVLGQADQALYAAKRAGRGRHLFYRPGMAMPPPEGAAEAGG